MGNSNSPRSPTITANKETRIDMINDKWRLVSGVCLSVWQPPMHCEKCRKNPLFRHTFMWLHIQIEKPRGLFRIFKTTNTSILWFLHVSMALRFQKVYWLHVKAVKVRKSKMKFPTAKKQNKLQGVLSCPIGHASTKIYFKCIARKRWINTTIYCPLSCHQINIRNRRWCDAVQFTTTANDNHSNKHF